jgi:hypothetical protein
MGYELKKLMNMYGVSTPTMAAAPQKPGDAPTALADGATAEQQAKYAADKAVFDENVRKYGLNQAQYDQYMRDYQNRLASTNMYNQAQFNTSGVNVMPQFADMLRSPVYEPLTAINVMPQTSGVPPVDTMNQTASMPIANSDQRGGGRDRDGMGGMGGRGNGTGTGSFGLPDPFGGGSRNTSGGYTGLRDMFDRGGPGVRGGRFEGGGRLSDIANAITGRARGGHIQNYAQGGSVKGYRPGGPVDMLYGGAGDDVMMGGSEEDTLPPVDPNAALEAMLNRYAKQTVTSEQIAAAAERRVAEQKAFEDILRSQLQGSDSEPMSKAEKYFRLAAAFGAPTKTGHFAENLGLVGEEMSSQLAAKAQLEREAREKRLGVDLEIQKARMAAAGEDFEALQGVQSEEAKYRQDLAKEAMQIELENLKEGIDQDPNVQSSAPLPDQSGVLMTLRDGSVQVRTVGGDLLFGQDAMDFVKEAQERSAEYQRSIYGARREGTLGAEAAAAAPGQISLFNTIEFQVNDLLNDPYLPNMLGPIASRTPNITADAARVQSKMDQISGGAFLQARQLLKGGGAITDFESKKAEQAFLRMNDAMNIEDYTKAMNDFLDAVRAGLPKLEDADSGLSDEDLQYLGDN